MATNLTRFDPFRDIARFDPFNRFEDIFSDFGVMPRLGSMETAPRICMDLSETDDAYTVKAEVAGARKEDIKVSIDGNQVSITAEVKREKDQTDENLVRSERYYGQQSRSFSLPQEVDDQKAVAKYNNGILELTLPKKPGTGSKQLAIQ